MLRKNELAEIAKLNNLRIWQQEKHYVQSLVLIALSEVQVVFKGGTYLWFFHGLNRFSEDLDFTWLNEVPESVEETVSKTLGMFGVENKIKKITNDERTYSFRVSAAGPLNTSERDMCHVYVEISKREKISRKPVALAFEIPAYSLPVKIISGMSLDEVAAEKIRAIISRDKARDLYDLHFLLARTNAALDLELAADKLKYYGIKFSKELLRRKIREKEPHWKAELSQLIFGELPEFGSVEHRVLEVLG